MEEFLEELLYKDEFDLQWEREVLWNDGIEILKKRVHKLSKFYTTPEEDYTLDQFLKKFGTDMDSFGVMDYS